VAKLHADKVYDSAEKRRGLRTRGITVRIARSSIAPSERLGRHRWRSSGDLRGSSLAAACECATSGEPTYVVADDGGSFDRARNSTVHLVVQRDIPYLLYFWGL
jgi:hypothetical protein